MKDMPCLCVAVQHFIYSNKPPRHHGGQAYIHAQAYGCFVVVVVCDEQTPPPRAAPASKADGSRATGTSIYTYIYIYPTSLFVAPVPRMARAKYSFKLHALARYTYIVAICTAEGTGAMAQRQRV